VIARSVTARSVTARSVTARSVTARSVIARSVIAGSVTARRVLALLVALAPTAGCDSANVDGGDLHDVFDKTASASRSGSATPPLSSAPPTGTGVASTSASTPPRIAPRTRTPVAGSCLAEEGEPAELNRRYGKRPACRRSRVLEHRDRDGTPRYGCVFESSKVHRTKPLPLVIFLHGEFDNSTAVHKKTRFRTRYHEIDLSGDPNRPGFIILAPQARKLIKSPSLKWDHGYRSRENVDVSTIDHFVDELLAAGLVDARQIYAIGESGGGEMAAVYAMLRPDRVAGFGVYAAEASRVQWTCDAPPPPAAVLYRACDRVVPCANVESWLSKREDAGLPTMSLRLGTGKATEPSCALSKSACREKKGTANHHRWPKHREAEMLEYLGRYSLRGKTTPAAPRKDEPRHNGD
jgi:pimeloyl-ACP methyl ester carboxylesterase